MARGWNGATVTKWREKKGMGERTTDSTGQGCHPNHPKGCPHPARSGPNHRPSTAHPSPIGHRPYCPPTLRHATTHYFRACTPRTYGPPKVHPAQLLHRALNPPYCTVLQLYSTTVVRWDYSCLFSSLQLAALAYSCCL